MKVLKFGGTSVQNSENIRKVINIVKNRREDTGLVVLSAFGGITQELIDTCLDAAKGNNQYLSLFADIEARHFEIIKELISEDNQQTIISQANQLLDELKGLLKGIFLLRELSPRSKDLILSFGERLSAMIICHAFNDRGIEAEYLDSREVIITDKNFTYASVNFEVTEDKIKRHFKGKKKLQVATGFIASSSDKETTTLGRGGSDYSAAIFSAALDAELLEIWTDVDGMMTADPRLVKKAFLIENISYPEALELSHFGSKVIQPQSILPALGKKIPIRIKNTFNPDCEGTLISEHTSDNGTRLIRGISSIDDVSLVTIEGSGLVGVVGIASRLFQAISKKSINVILITQGSSEHSITFAVRCQDAWTAKELIEEEFKAEIKLNLVEPVKIENDLTIIAVVGENMKNRAGISARLFTAVGRNGISVIATAQGASELNISLVIQSLNAKKALNAIHEDFFLSDTKSINLFIVGTGTIGGTLLDQIASQRKNLAENFSIEINIAGIANQDYDLLREQGIEPNNWRTILERDGKPVNILNFVRRIKDLNLRNSIFVDNTASPDIAAVYEELLNANVSVVTPNKIANASKYDTYKKIQTAAGRYGVRFLYETNVGAGLPIINTLQDLLNSGDKIIRIEAILSGSLNYIFSTFSDTKNFYETVKEAKELGFTEPDPRQDLSGMDVARKILILGREAGLNINLEDVVVESCMSEESEKAGTLDEYWESLKKVDNEIFENKRLNAEKTGKRLKYIATFKNNNASTAIKEVGPEHPFYNILGSNNIISFTTERYKNNPLIVIGPGAGAEVTAAGIFADIIRIVNF